MYNKHLSIVSLSQWLPPCQLHIMWMQVNSDRTLIAAAAGCHAARQSCVGMPIRKLQVLFLVGGWATPLKNRKVNWDDYSQYMGK